MNTCSCSSKDPLMNVSTKAVYNWWIGLVLVDWSSGLHGLLPFYLED